MFYQAVEALPRQTRRVILLALDGLDNRHIAAEMGISENTVHMLKRLPIENSRLCFANIIFLSFASSVDLKSFLIIFKKTYADTP